MCTSDIASVFPVVPAYLPSSANVLICCLVQPDGFLTLHWGMMGGGEERWGRKGSHLQRYPLIKNPSA